MKTRTNLETMIFSALCENAKQNDSFMDYTDIGRAIFGNGYLSQTAPIFDKMIKDRMFKVRELAEQNGMLVIPRRKPIRGSSEKKFRILGWKLATVKDEKYIQDELMFKAERINITKVAAVKMLNTAVQNKLIEGNDKLGIAM